MKYIICNQPKELLIKEKTILQPASGEVLLKIKKIGICGTDIHAFEGVQPFFDYPRILGHELAAEYVSGNRDGFKEGDKVTVIPYFHCGTCIACRNGYTNCCEKIKVFGVHIDGGMSEYITIPESYIINGEGLSYDQLVLVEPLSIAAHGIRRAKVQENDVVLVMGIGPIGAGLIEFAKIAGAAKIIAVDINPFRLEHAKTVLGADVVINPLNENLIEVLREVTNGDMPTVVIDATGNKKVMNDAFTYMAHGGRYVLVGLQRDNLSFSHPEFHKREATLMSSRNATISDFEFVMDMLRSGRINPSNYITNRLAFDDVPASFQDLLSKGEGVLKAVIDID